MKIKYVTVTGDRSGEDKPVCVIEQKFPGDISTTTLLVRVMRKHLVNDRENGEITYEGKAKNHI